VIGLQAIQELKFTDEPVDSADGESKLEQGWEQALTAYRLMYGTTKQEYPVLLVSLVFHWDGKDAMDTKYCYCFFDGNEGKDHKVTFVKTVGENETRWNETIKARARSIRIAAGGARSSS
jgi:hypothetical protein